MHIDAVRGARRSPIRPIPSSISGGARTAVFAKGLQILRIVVAESGPITLKALAERTGIAVSTAHRLLEDLEMQGWVVQDKKNCRIEIGSALIGLAAAVTARYGIEEAVRPILKSLVTETGETVCLNLLDMASGRLVTFVVEESDRPLSYRLSPGEVTYLHTGASGRAAMAFLQTAALKEVLARHGLPKLTNATITSHAKLKAALAQVRKTGYAYSKGERLAEAIGIAAPVFGRDGVIRGSLLISILRSRFSPSSKTALARSVIACAARLRDFVDPLDRKR